MASLKDVFQQFDFLNRGFITKLDIKKVIESNEQHVSSVTSMQRCHPDSVEMEALIRRFNKDRSNGRISLTEWIDELTPMIN